MLPILEQALGRELVLPKRKISSVEEFVQLFPEVKDVLVDGTERPIQRPKNQDRQKANYSGKKKRHTKKNLVVSDGQKVLMLSATEAGKRHDYQMFKQSGLGDCLAGEGYLWVDLGFQGIGKDYPQLQVIIPHKKRHGEQLSKQQKRINRIIAQGRIFVEHVLSGIKRLRAVSEVYRHRREGIEDQFMLLACGLWNYHLKLAG